METTGEALKYFFDVEFTDGTIYTQNQNDESVLQPERRSCFFDVMKMIEDGKVIKKFMIGDGKNFYAVFLDDGHFEVNDIPFFMHNNRSLKDFKIYFYRQHDRHFIMGRDGKLPQEVGHDVVYQLGWETEFEGQKIKQIMEVS